MNLQLARFVRSHEQVFHHRCAHRRFDTQLHQIAVLHSELLSVTKTHVNVACRPDYAFAQFNDSLRPDEHAAGSSFNLAAVAHRSTNAERNRIGERQFDLAEWSRGAKYPNRGQCPLTRADDHDRLFGSIEAVLIKVLHGRQGMSRAEQNLNMLVGQVTMSSRNADDKFPTASTWSRRRGAANLLRDDLSNDPFDRRSVQCRSVRCSCGCHDGCFTQVCFVMSVRQRQR